MSQNYDYMYLGRSEKNTEPNEKRNTNLSDSQFEKYGKVGRLMVKHIAESYEKNLTVKNENKMRD